MPVSRSTFLQPLHDQFFRCLDHDGPTWVCCNDGREIDMRRRQSGRFVAAAEVVLQEGVVRRVQAGND